MQIQVNTDNHTQGSDELTQRVEDLVEGALARFGDRITRVEVQLSDQNSGQKSGGADKRCSMEARLTGLQPIVVSADAPSHDQALNSAANKLEKTLQRTLGRLDNPKGRTSFAGEPSD
jgi:ribosome-associated translation inhibitor RaiA